MKKILFASTALIATTGMAAAEISLSGFGRFGVVYEEDAAEETQIEQRLRITISGTTESDAGIQFGGRVRMESNDGDQDSISNGGFGAAELSVKFGGANFYVGKTSDVLDSGDVLSWGGKGVGFLGNIEQVNNVGTKRKVGFGTGDNDETVVKFDYSVGDFTIALSYADDDTEDSTSTPVNYAVGASAQIGLGYNFGNYSVGAVYGTVDGDAASATGEDFDQWALGFGGTFGDLGVNAIVFDNSKDDEDTVFGVSAEYAVNSALAVTAAISTGGADANDTTYGVGASYDLGGGVSVSGGIGSLQSGNTYADLGVKFNF